MTTDGANAVTVRGAIGVIFAIALIGGSTAAQTEPDSCSPEDLGGIQCGAELVRVETRAVYLDRSGNRRPVRGLRVFSGYHEDDMFSGDLRRVRAKVTKNGELLLMASIPHSVRTVCVDGKWRDDETTGVSHYLLRAKGCHDLTIEVTGDWSAGVLTMECKGE